MLDSLCSEIDVEFAAYNSNFNIDLFSSGTAIIDKNENSGYDVIFLDIDMPEVSRFDIAEQIVFVKQKVHKRGSKKCITCQHNIQGLEKYIKGA